MGAVNPNKLAGGGAMLVRTRGREVSSGGTEAGESAVRGRDGLGVTVCVARILGAGRADREVSFGTYKETMDSDSAEHGKKKTERT